ncbi:hypothetical protein JKA74_20155 [Marivirga sp. S37H4]|uniref:Glycine zipper family protein n=1 Tax=Marivirga aurantiaca TaxID=2802615 RepID=A0A934X2Q9_9BACT|nr:hypothetical protein [Marivirga aurantiaca]MBK6267367.1 hypothetical protein [Marivirga aurantiaca]
MKYGLVVFVFTILFSNVVQAQSDVPLIERKKEFLQNQYYILGENVPLRKVVKIMLPHTDAHKLIRSSRRLNFLAATTAGLGLSAIASQLVSLEDNRGFNFAIGGLGAGLFLGAVGISIKADKRADLAIELYNSRKLISKKVYRNHLGMVFNSRGIGINWTF